MYCIFNGKDQVELNNWKKTYDILSPKYSIKQNISHLDICHCSAKMNLDIWTTEVTFYLPFSPTLLLQLFKANICMNRLKSILL